MFQKLFRSSVTRNLGHLLRASVTRAENANIYELPHIRKIEYKLPVLPRCEVRLPVFNKNVLNPIDECVLHRNSEIVYDLPTTSINQNIEKLAHRMLVIRRKKMKKHKLRKKLKRLKFFLAKRRQRKLVQKEKAFQALLVSQVKEADNFDADQYVNERIDKLLKLRTLSSQNTSFTLK